MYEILRLKVTDENNKELFRRFRLEVKKRLNAPFQVRKKGRVLFNHMLNTFYLQLDGVGRTLHDYSDNERKYIILGGK